ISLDPSFEPPTAQTFVGERAVTADRPLPCAPDTSCVGLIAHSVPFQCSARACSTPPWSMEYPAVQASFAESALTAQRMIWPESGGFGLGTTLHFLPFQCSITVAYVVKSVTENPAAQMSLAATASTPVRFTATPDELGLCTICHRWPFQCSTSPKAP